MEHKSEYVPLEIDLEQLNAVAEGERRTVVEILNEGRTPEKVLEVAENANGWAQHLIEQVIANGPLTPPACAPGCDYCCTVAVFVEPPEVFRIAEYLRRHLPAGEYRALARRLATLDTQTRGWSPTEWDQQRPTCVLLKDRRCRVYPVRPLNCQAWNALNRQECKREYAFRRRQHSPNRHPAMMYGWHVALGMRSGLTDVGLQAGPLEMLAALRIALEAENGLERWLAGEPVFAGAEAKAPAHI